MRFCEIKSDTNNTEMDTDIIKIEKDGQRKKKSNLDKQQKSGYIAGFLENEEFQTQETVEEEPKNLITAELLCNLIGTTKMITS